MALACLQLLAVGYAKVLAGTAAEAGALALAAGADPRAGVREALPGWARARARIAVDGGPGGREAAAAGGAARPGRRLAVEDATAAAERLGLPGRLVGERR